MSFPDRFRTAQFSFLLKYENECVHGRILLLVLLLLSVLPLAPLPLQRRYHYYTEEFLPLLFSTWQKFHGRVRNSQKPVRNRPNAISLSLPCLFPHPPIRTPTPTPIAISTTTTASATAPAGTTVSFPDRFRTAQAYFAPKFEIECVHAWILTLITRFATTPSTTTTPAATAPPCTTTTTTTTSTPRNFCSCF